MKDTLATLWMLVLVSLRNLRSHRIKTFIVGAILVFGSALVVVGTSLVDSIEAGMARSITSSISGHLQIYSANAEDDLALFGGLAFDNQNIGEIRTFADVKNVAEGVDNVRAVVPQGSGSGMAMTGNEIDEVLYALRKALLEDDDVGVESAIAGVRHTAAILEAEFQNTMAIADDAAGIEEILEDLERVATDAFWRDLRADPPELLEFLDTRIAPLAADGRSLFLRFLGTDLDLYRESFENFYIERGEMIPPFRRGLLLNHRSGEQYYKNRIARSFDSLYHEIVEEGRTIASAPTLQAIARQMSRQYSRIILELGPEDTLVVKAALQEHLGSDDDDLGVLLQSFLLVDDTNFLERHEFFYEVIGPRIRVYLLDVGDTITIRAMTRAGYMRAVNVKIYGTYSFRGLETSDLARAGNLVDKLTFREIYGVMSDEQIEELQGIRDEVGVQDIDRASAEDDLFGGGELVVVPSIVVPSETTEAMPGIDDHEITSRAQRIEDSLAEIFTQDTIDSGLTLHAAIILDDASRLEETRRDLEQAFAANDLEIKVVHWQEAAGIVGQFITVIRLVL
ncbi:MAG: hypothetical protein ACNA8W_07305, partial [Bradymonadaceae bacterium]